MVEKFDFKIPFFAIKLRFWLKYEKDYIKIDIGVKHKGRWDYAGYCILPLNGGN